MAKINGSSFLLFIDGVALGSTKTSSINISVDIPLTSTQQSGGWETNLAGGGMRSAEGSFDGLEDPSDTVGVNEIYDLINTRADFDFEITDDTAGSNIWTGTATVSNLTVNYEMEQPVSISGTFKLNGVLVRATET